MKSLYLYNCEYKFPKIRILETKAEDTQFYSDAKCTLIKQYNCSNSDCNENLDYDFENLTINDGYISFVYNIKENKIIDNSNSKIEIKNNIFYINGNKVDLYNKSDYKNQYGNESNFYNATEYDENRQYDYKVINDVVFVKTYFSYFSYFYKEAEYYFIDGKGNIVKKINGNNADIVLSVNDNNLEVMIDHIDGNTIYLDVYKNPMLIELTHGAMCSLRYNAEKMKDVYYYIDKITYIGDDNFNVEQKIETKMYDEYILEISPFIECYPYTLKSYKYGYKVQGIDNYYADIENGVLKLVDGNGNLISELVKLENISDFILEMLPGARYMKVEDNTKICSVSKDGIYVFMGSNRSLGDRHKDYSHMHVIYYDINTGEKSELIKADAEGHFGDLATCR